MRRNEGYAPRAGNYTLPIRPTVYPRFFSISLLLPRAIKSLPRFIYGFGYPQVPRATLSDTEGFQG